MHPDSILALLEKYGDVKIVEIRRELTSNRLEKMSTRFGALALLKTHKGEYVLIRHTYDIVDVTSRDWTIPGGKVEVGETFEEAALRETREETGINAQTKGLYKIFHHIHQYRNGVEEWYLPVFFAEALAMPINHKTAEIGEVHLFRKLPENFAGALNEYYSDLR